MDLGSLYHDRSRIHSGGIVVISMLTWGSSLSRQCNRFGELISNGLDASARHKCNLNWRQALAESSRFFYRHGKIGYRYIFNSIAIVQVYKCIVHNP